jgi:hypothetical protein
MGGASLPLTCGSCGPGAALVSSAAIGWSKGEWGRCQYNDDDAEETYLVTASKSNIRKIPWWWWTSVRRVGFTSLHVGRLVCVVCVVCVVPVIEPHFSKM